jgi:hypothetical protein
MTDLYSVGSHGGCLLWQLTVLSFVATGGAFRPLSATALQILIDIDHRLAP